MGSTIQFRHGENNIDRSIERHSLIPFSSVFIYEPNKVAADHLMCCCRRRCHVEFSPHYLVTLPVGGQGIVPDLVDI